jgi:hypothetical protein
MVKKANNAQKCHTYLYFANNITESNALPCLPQNRQSIALGKCLIQGKYMAGQQCTVKKRANKAQ